MSDIVVELRSAAFDHDSTGYVMDKAADEIERLRGALQRIKDSDGRFDTVHEIATSALSPHQVDPAAQ